MAQAWGSAGVLLGAAVVAMAEGSGGDSVLIRPWGDDAVRVQIAPAGTTLSDALPSAIPASWTSPRGQRAGHGGNGATPIVSGNIKVERGDDGLIVVSRVSDSKVLLKETARTLNPAAGSSLTFDFSSCATKLYGMGQNRHQDNGGGLGLNVVGQTYDFQASIGEEGGPSNSLPWTIGASPETGFQFGILFNSPAMGGASFTDTHMTWTITQDAGNQNLRKQLDFLITTHNATASQEDKPFQIIERYVDAVGHARKQTWPGYWHSKNRYSSQEELLTAARGFHNRSIPVDVIVIDWFHWKVMGDWSFNPVDWPDPKAMVEECKSYGMEIMVSVWPFTCPGSRSYDTLVKNNWVTTYVSANGTRTNIPIETHGKNCHHVDATNPEFRKYAWSLIESGYYNYGIKIFWLDASEPEGFGPLASNASWLAGDMRDMGSMFTLYWTQVFYDGLRAAGETEFAMLPRAGWVGTWRHGAALWSGDIGSDMPTLKSQLNIGLSAQQSGIPWWTTDVGGYHGGHSTDPAYRETIVRWFQYGFACPMLRQHGQRDYTVPWAYGPTDEQIIADIIKLRATMKPYFSSQLDALNETGRPFNRPLMWDFPNDPMTWTLAEGGIGDEPASNSSADHSLHNGDFVVISQCNSSAWNQQWALSRVRAKKREQNCLHLTDSQASGLCLDDGGNPGATPPTGPYKIHMWSRGFASAQQWTYDATAKQFKIGSNCLDIADHKHPNISPCNSSPSQQWTFTSGGTIENAMAGCLEVVKRSAASVGVADQFMMGNDYMVAPVLNAGQSARKVYFPKGANWVHHYTGVTYPGGSTALVPAPLHTFPLFKRIAQQ